MAANRQTDIHTHMHNAVTLVWGSLRLAPILKNLGIKGNLFEGGLFSARVY